MGMYKCVVGDCERGSKSKLFRERERGIERLSVCENKRTTVGKNIGIPGKAFGIKTGKWAALVRAVCK